nr:ionotropic receptor 75a-like [Danaus plexippus plexippus]
MLAQAIAALFKYKVVASVIVLACWTPSDWVNFNKELGKHGLIVTFSCDPSILEYSSHPHLQGVLFMPSENHNSFLKMKTEYFGYWYKWIIVGQELPEYVSYMRYDADVFLIRNPDNSTQTESDGNRIIKDVPIDDIYFHPGEGVSSHPWGSWTVAGLQILYEKERIQRRRNLRRYPLRIATPIGSYSKDTYNGTFHTYITDIKIPERDSAIRSSYNSCLLISEILNATDVLVPTMLWSTEINNSSMMLELRLGASELAGGVLRMTNERILKLDYVMCIWPFSVGFTYLAERESNNNMFLEPFTPKVWLCCLGLFVILALAQRATARTKHEKDGAYIAVLATTLQQDASAVPAGISGRWTFLVLSVFSILIHGYYTSAIVSGLMNAGRGGPNSLRALGDSKYAIASEEYDYMKYTMFDVETNWDDLEYLKKKKLTSTFYQDIKVGVQLMRAGSTAFHSEYNQLYPHLKSFTDDELCKLQSVDTIPEINSWVTTMKRGQWTPAFRIAGAWLHEVGLAKRLVNHLRIKPPPCRAALLAERVNFDDVTPIILIYVAAIVTSVIFMLIEITVANWQIGRN